jgi:hypothetical protein
MQNEMAGFPFTALDIVLLVAGIAMLGAVSLLCRRLLRVLDTPAALEAIGEEGRETVRRLDSAPSLARPPARRPSTAPRREETPERRSAAGKK